MSGEKEIRIKDAEIIVGDGSILVRFSKPLDKGKKRFEAAFDADGLYMLAQDCGVLAPENDPDLPGVVIVTAASLADEGEDSPGLEGIDDEGDIDLQAMIDNRKEKVDPAGDENAEPKEGV